MPEETKMTSLLSKHGRNVDDDGAVAMLGMEETVAVLMDGTSSLNLEAMDSWVTT